MWGWYVNIHKTNKVVLMREKIITRLCEKHGSGKRGVLDQLGIKKLSPKLDQICVLDQLGIQKLSTKILGCLQHLASLCRISGDKIEDHKRKVDTNRFVSEIHQIWKYLMLLDSPNVHPPLKNNQRKKANFKCK